MDSKDTNCGANAYVFVIQSAAMKNRLPDPTVASPLAILWQDWLI